jgi:hypothetical protein
MTSKSRSVKAPGDSTLQGLWRQVVRAEWGNRCALAGEMFLEPGGMNSVCQGELQCHHIIPRARPHLKHVPANGVLLCASHHNAMKYRVWRDRLDEKIGSYKLEWLEAIEMTLFKDFLSDEGMTRAEYLTAQKVYLQSLLKADALNGRGE